MANQDQLDYTIRTLGPCTVPSRLDRASFVEDGAGVLADILTGPGFPPLAERTSLECAGPRRRLFFDPGKARAAIVTCGGLCPGLNDVIRATTMVLWYRYGVREILGIRYGYLGLVPDSGEPPVPLEPDLVADIHEHGGTVLGSSRGPQDPARMADFLADREVDMLFAIGGDGTQRGALAIAEELERRKLPIAVVGMPKTIDNDIACTERTFGFETAVEMCQGPINSAHMEAKGVSNGVGLVKLMGRESGFIAASAALASSNVNLVLIPEVPFTMERIYAYLEERLERKSHAVVVAAEGAGQELVSAAGADASGNRKLGDIGLYLKSAITDRFRTARRPAHVKYIDPSYTIRSVRANADDSVFCFRLAEHAVHAAMSGRTEMVVGLRNGHFVHIPSEHATRERKRIDPAGSFWQSVLENTGQPSDLT